MLRRRRRCSKSPASCTPLPPPLHSRRFPPCARHAPRLYDLYSRRGGSLVERRAAAGADVRALVVEPLCYYWGVVAGCVVFVFDGFVFFVHGLGGDGWCWRWARVATPLPAAGCCSSSPVLLSALITIVAAAATMPRSLVVLAGARRLGALLPQHVELLLCFMLLCVLYGVCRWCIRVCRGCAIRPSVCKQLPAVVGAR